MKPANQFIPPMFLPLPEEVKTFFSEIKSSVEKLQGWDELSPGVRDKAREAKNFTPDGRMVGDVGEVLAERYFKIRLEKNQKAGYDAVLEDDEMIRVEIKMTKKGIFQFRKIPDRVIAFSVLEGHAEVEVVFNGPGKILVDKVQTLSKATWKENHWTLSNAINVKPEQIRGLGGFAQSEAVPLRPGVKPLRGNNHMSPSPSVSYDR